MGDVVYLADCRAAAKRAADDPEGIEVHIVHLGPVPVQPDEFEPWDQFWLSLAMLASVFAPGIRVPWRDFP